MSTPAFHVSFQRQLPAKRTRANRPFRAIANKVKYLSAKTHVHFYLLSATCSRDLRLRVHSPVLQDTKAVASMKGWPRLPLGESDGPHHVQSSMHAQLEHWMVPLYITHPRPHSMRSTTTLVRRTGSGFALIRPHFTAIPSIPHFLALFFFPCLSENSRMHDRTAPHQCCPVKCRVSRASLSPLAGPPDIKFGQGGTYVTINWRRLPAGCHM